MLIRGCSLSTLRAIFSGVFLASLLTCTSLMIFLTLGTDQTENQHTSNLSLSNELNDFWNSEQNPLRSFRFYIYELGAEHTDELWERARKEIPGYFDPHNALNHHASDYYILKGLRNHPCRTSKASEADIFFVPLQVNLWAKFRVFSHNKVFKEEILPLYTDKRDMWDGMDHYVVNKFAVRFDYFIPHINSIGSDIRVTKFGANEKALGKKGLENYGGNIVIPYPDFTGAADFTQKELEGKRELLAVFVGTLSKNSKDLRANVKKELDRCNDCLWQTLTSRYELEAVDIPALMKKSVFGISPRGDTHNSRRIYNSVMLETIPVILCDWCILPYEHVIDYNKAAVFLNESLVGKGGMVKALRGISQEEIEEKKAYLREIKKRFIFHDGYVEKDDAVDTLVQELALRGLWLRRLKRFNKSNRD